MPQYKRLLKNYQQLMVKSVAQQNEINRQHNTILDLQKEIIRLHGLVEKSAKGQISVIKYI